MARIVKKELVILTPEQRKNLAVNDPLQPTNPDKSNWEDITVRNSWYDVTRVPGELYGKHVLKHSRDFLAEPYMDGVTTGYINKTWRALILARQMVATPKPSFDKKDPAKGSSVIVKARNRDKEKRDGKVVTVGDKVIKLLNVTYKGDADNSFLGFQDHIERSDKLKQKGINNNQIIIYNTSVSPYEYLVIQTRPYQLDFKGETTWASIKSMGRNTPLYQYTGAEDTIQFNISWYCTDINNPHEVVSKCRLLESWTKSNGYSAAPPILQIQWGGTEEDNLLVNQDFILISATYSLQNFSSMVRRDLDKYHAVNTEGYTETNLKLYPMAATQELIFKRVSSTNLTYNNILPSIQKEKIIKKRTL